MRLRFLIPGLLLCLSKAFAAPSLPAAAAPCVECHGADGVAVKPGVPHLNGQLEEYIADSMAAFKDRKRPSSAEAHGKPGLTEKEMAATAKFFAAQKKVKRPAQPIDPARVAAATATYNQRCTKCHLDDGRESDHDAPLMAGQVLDYLQAQTEAYVSGKRSFPFLMDDAYRGLSKEDLINMSHYFAAAKM